MKLALLGKDISHSRSPEVYRELLGEGITYDLRDFPTEDELPTIAQLNSDYSAVNITSPYKEHYFFKVQIEDPTIRKIRAINTIVFHKDGAYGTNTDFLAVKKILGDFQQIYGEVYLVLLGSGVMARLTQLAALDLSIPVRQYSRQLGDSMDDLNLTAKSEGQTIVVNSCSRKFVFKGKINPDHIFWDYNYNFLPHQQLLSSMVKTYIDGQSLLRLQAEEAVRFWSSHRG